MKKIRAFIPFLLFTALSVFALKNVHKPKLESQYGVGLNPQSLLGRSPGSQSQQKLVLYTLSEKDLFKVLDKKLKNTPWSIKKVHINAYNHEVSLTVQKDQEFHTFSYIFTKNNKAGFFSLKEGKGTSTFFLQKLISQTDFCHGQNCQLKREGNEVSFKKNLHSQTELHSIRPVRYKGGPFHYLELTLLKKSI